MWLPCSSNAPEWLTAVYCHIVGAELGSHFVAAGNAWLRMESASRLEEGPALPKKGRPTALVTWLKAISQEPPYVVNVRTFAKTFCSWWDSMQPSWRTKSPDGSWVLGEYGGRGQDWGVLFTWGSGGVVGIICGLYMWGMRVKDDAQAQLDWLAVVADVGWILDGMVTYYDKFKHRW
ncbi:hypothetical protein C8F01DRAFT_1001616 [Mycena amicta]|nr:hypothetical protein C8F01DRAFT_1001616 [Mycena amicta]